MLQKISRIKKKIGHFVNFHQSSLMFSLIKDLSNWFFFHLGHNIWVKIIFLGCSVTKNCWSFSALKYIQRDFIRIKSLSKNSHCYNWTFFSKSTYSHLGSSHKCPSHMELQWQVLGSFLFVSGSIHVPFWHPGKTTHSSQFVPVQPL